ncbi:MAG: hypothetical protein KGP08_09350, partial [Xanthomonadaceae bacterium]|nr:hypothetical protein [Xanthomonadaceae bacterium]
HPEARVFGYLIERLEEYEDTGLACTPRFEVLCPKTGAVLGAFDDAHAAKRFAVVHELRAIREGTQRLNKGIRAA